MIDSMFYYLGMLVTGWIATGFAVAIIALSWEWVHSVINRMEWKTSRASPHTTA